MPFPLRSSKAILHVDGDAFFAACEVSLDPSLRGKPVVTGLERNIAAAMTYEAKRRGVTRGMILSEVRKICPDAVILASDYETYAIFSRRMYSIVRRYTPVVEEYSIDECFADLSGLRRMHRMPFRSIALAVKADLEKELGMTFSVGLGPSKVLAKAGSRLGKPAGFTAIAGRDIEAVLGSLDIGKVWGIGPNTAAYLRAFGMKTALEFAMKDEAWIKENLAKPQHELWHELRGTSVLPVAIPTSEPQQSIGKTRTFTPPSANRTFVFSELSRNVENACFKARRHGLAARYVSFFLKRQDFRRSGSEQRLREATSIPSDIIAAIEPEFARLFSSGTPYRATGVTLSGFEYASRQQLGLFESAAPDIPAEVYERIDILSRKHGRHAVFLGSSLAARIYRGKQTRNIAVKNIPGDPYTGRRIGIPFMGEVF
jgi:nucleotidyltransferase/DNA polymerase involved in DNA repair